MPPVTLPPCLEPAKFVFSPNHWERDDKEKYQSVIKDGKENDRQDVYHSNCVVVTYATMNPHISINDEIINNQKFIKRYHTRDMHLDNDIVYTGIDFYTIYWMMPIMFSYSTIIQSVVWMHLSSLGYIYAATRQRLKKDHSFMITGTNCGIDGCDMRPMDTTSFSKSDGYKAVNDHCDFPLDDENKINNKDN